MSAPNERAARHPRLWLRASDLPRLRAWARPKNPMWTALSAVAERARAVMDAGKLPRGPACTDESGVYTCEGYAELFAFMSLVDADEATRRADAARADTLLLAVVDEVNRGPRADDPLRGDNFAVSDRSRWSGEAFGLATDWIYPWLPDDHKRRIRAAFLRWADADEHARTTSHNHPEPEGVVDDRRLVADRERARFAANNYFTAHMRNLGLMALSFDPEDDPDGELGAHLKTVTGAWLYMIDDLMRGDARGGLPPDGLEYGPQTFAYVAELLLALHSSGAERGDERQTRFADNPWWSELETAWFHLLPAKPIEHSWMGPLWLPAWYGEGQKSWLADPIDLFGPLGIWARDAGAARTFEIARYIERNLPPGGADKLEERVAKNDDFRQSILYFLLFDPDAPPPRDPRPGLPKSWFAPGVGRLYARTGFGPDASVFDIGLSWTTIDHQHADGLAFDWSRKGEWLTKERTGYGTNIGCSDYHNTLAVENDKPYHAKDASDYRAVLWRRGSQWVGSVNDGDGKILARSVGDGYAYFAGDATPLYNSKSENSRDVERVARAAVWLMPDHLVVYDRAATGKDGRWKRFWLQLPALPKLEGRRASVRTPLGQALFVSTLLPEDARVSAAPVEPLKENSEPADQDPIVARLVVESRARDVRFLHVLEAADAGKAAGAAALVDAGPGYLAALAGDTVVAFPRALGEAPAAECVLAPPPGARTLVVVGFAPGEALRVERLGDGRVRVGKGKDVRADDGGLLRAPLLR